MNTASDIPDLRKALSKKPKSAIFARLADEIRMANQGQSNKLNEAFEIAEKGLAANPDFLQGRMVRGRILFDKGDFAGAKLDFEFVAEKDPFCLAAHKLLLETLAKLNESPQNEIYAKILDAFEPGSNPNPQPKQPAPVAKAESAKPQPAPARVEKAQPQPAPQQNKPLQQDKSVANALDDLLKEDDTDTDTDMDIAELKDSLLKTFGKIFGKIIAPADASSLPPATPGTKLELTPEPKPKPKLEPTPEPKPEPKLEPMPEPKPEPKLEPMPEPKPEPKPEPELKLPEAQGLTLPEARISEPLAGLESTSLASSSSPNLDDILNEQLADKSESLPDLTGDLDALLASAPQAQPEPEPEKPVALETTAIAPNLDDILNEQLADKSENLPDLTNDLDTLLASAPQAQPEPEPEKPVALETTAIAPNLDDILNEQLADKSENLPDLTNDLDTLLASAPQELPEPEPEPEKPIALETFAAAPNIDDILNEQLADKSENLPNLTGDLNTLLASASQELPEPEPEKPIALETFAAAPNIDAIVSEQLVDKSKNFPDLTNDLDALLASAPQALLESELKKPATQKTTAAAPNLNDILSEQLADKSENLPDLTTDLKELLASELTINEFKETEEEPALIPYVPPEQRNPSGQANAFAQTPTLTLAELYLSQNLPEKAVEVYKELLVRNPNNVELQGKLELAELQIKG